MLQKYDNWWQDKKLESDLEEQQRSNQVYNDPPKDNVGINLGWIRGNFHFDFRASICHFCRKITEIIEFGGKILAFILFIIFMIFDCKKLNWEISPNSAQYKFWKNIHSNDIFRIRKPSTRPSSVIQ